METFENGFFFPATSFCIHFVFNYVEPVRGSYGAHGHRLQPSLLATLSAALFDVTMYLNWIFALNISMRNFEYLIIPIELDAKNNGKIKSNSMPMTSSMLSILNPWHIRFVSIDCGIAPLGQFNQMQIRINFENRLRTKWDTRAKAASMDGDATHTVCRVFNKII